MKKYIVIIIILLLVLLIVPTKKEDIELRGVFVSYIEINEYLKNKDEISSKIKIEEMITNIKSLKLNTIILQVRPSLDSIYFSNIFPLSTYLTDNNYYPYDVLDYFLKEAHKNNIKIYAWINPYRIRTTGNVNDISPNSPVYNKRYTDLVYEGSGLFLNPSKKETNNLILEGIKEVLEYDVDGILFDDYFYPSDDIDINDYNNYLKENSFLSLKDYHLQVVNNMLYEVHNLCKEKNVPFGISPEGNIENNYEKNYADVLTWLKSNKYVDFIMPQLYYGFENSSKPFINTSTEWNKYINNEIPLYIALAVYKSNKIDLYAAQGEKEWLNNHDIIKKEIAYSRELSNYKGFVLYRYDNVFIDEHSKEEVKNLELLLNE